MNDPHAALDAIGQLPDVEIDVADAALQLARVDAPDADWQAARAHLSALARDAIQQCQGVAADDLLAQSRALHALVADKHKYRGDAETYDDPINANLIRVIERRRGLPVALGIIWLHTARAVGWIASGIDFPAHFLIALSHRDRQVVIDAFAHGALLDARALRVLLKSVEGDKAELRPDLLRPMSNRAVLLRLQNNIRTRRLNAGALSQALACGEDMLRIAPDHAALWREVALMHQRLDHVTAALRCFERFVSLAPTGEAATRARAAIDELRSRLN